MHTIPYLKIQIDNSIKLSKSAVKTIEERPGIYIFLNSEKLPIYIGKSVSLKKRILSYLTLPLELKTQQMISEAKYFTTIYVSSEIEALLLEAKLIKLYTPKYNIELKDDKHPLYIQITSDKYPRVLFSRKQSSLDKSKDVYFGPFPSSSNVKSVLKMIRRIFPYAIHKPEKRQCLYSQIGLCKPCPSNIEKVNETSLKIKLIRQYRRNIKLIKLFLEGDLDRVRLNLTKLMEFYSRNQNYEQANEIKQKLSRIDYITKPITPPLEFIINPNLIEDVRKKEMDGVSKLLKPYLNLGEVKRVECFDVAHIAGANPTASMVTFYMGEADKDFYRRFKIRQKKGSDDIASMTEVAKRRAKRISDWGEPDLIIVDGGKTQSSVFFKVFKEYKIPVVGLAKRFETVIIPFQNGEFEQIQLPKGEVRNFFQRIRNEAHRFARSYHHKLIKKELLS